jgi:hypothetical protein
MPEGKTTPTLAERIRASAEKAERHTTGYAQATAAKTQVKATPKVEAKQEDEIQVADRTAVELKITENLFYKALTDTQTTQEEKISQIANALDPKQQTMEQLHENYQLFQQYYTYLQSEELEEALENIRRLMKELQGNTKIEIAAILANLKGMLDDVGVSRDLVEVLRKARITGQTIKELSEAVDRNEQIIVQLSVLTGAKKTAETEFEAAQRIVTERVNEREAEEKKTLNRVLSLFTNDTRLSDRVTTAEAASERKGHTLTEINNRIAELNAARRKDLEEGPLKILRSMDEVDDNLSQRLISSGNRGIATIQGAQKSVLQLMQRTLFSETEVDKIARRVADKQISLTVLKSGLTIASQSTNEHKEGLEQKSGETEAALAAAKAPESGVPSTMQIAKNETAAINIRSDIGEVIDYQSKLNDTITEMGVTLSKNIERQGETDRQRTIVQGTKKSITVLGRDTLNTVAGNLEGVLHNLTADQTDETQQAIVAFSRAAENVKHGSLESMMTRQAEMHGKDMEFLDDTIKRLNASQELIARTLETSVDEGIARAEKQRELTAAAAALEQATTTMRTVVGKMSNEAVSDGPTKPAANGQQKPRAAERAPS